MSKEATEQITIKYVKIETSPAFHLTGYMDGLNYNGMPCHFGTNLTSNIDRNCNIQYFGTPAQKNPQNQTNLEVWHSNFMKINHEHRSSGFQLVVEKLNLLE